ncbi:hypothetical protein ACM5Q9_09665 [Advenella sp. RU8]|uniref:hypothetical protein n=1 Tax=Advenella sp. RU8 TaxID=3399575 RepID=UPI003AAAD54E
MRIRKLLASICLGAFCVPAFAEIDIDITNHPDKDFILGYKKSYPHDCDVMWWASRWNTLHLQGLGECKGITESQVMSDLQKEMARIKSIMDVENFSDYYLIEQAGGPANRLPEKYWSYMEGYLYKYSKDCTVRWAKRASAFITFGDCQNIGNEKLKADAIKSIEYAQARSKAKNFDEYYREIESKPKTIKHYSQEQAKSDAKELWRRTCIDAKSLRPTPFNEMAEQYPGIDRMHAARLFSNARMTVQGLGGMVNCAEQSYYVVEMYASDIDIRAK